MKLWSIYVCGIVLSMLSCQSKTAAPSSVDMAEVTRLETALKTNFNLEQSNALVGLYEQLIAEAPDAVDEKAIVYGKIAQLQRRGQQIPKAIATLETALQTCYEAKSSPENALLLGSIYKEDLKNVTVEEFFFQSFMEAYPSHHTVGKVDEDYGKLSPFYNRLMVLGGLIFDPSTQENNPSNAQHFVTTVRNQALLLPKDSLSAEYLMKGAEVASLVGKYDQSEMLLDQVMTQFPKHPKAGRALFMKAFLYDENLKDDEKAKPLYEAFIKQYPKDEMVASAIMLLKNLGKSDEEILNSLQGK